MGDSIPDKTSQETALCSASYESALIDLVCIAGLLHGDLPPGTNSGTGILSEDHKIFYQWPFGVPTSELIESKEARDLLSAHHGRGDLCRAAGAFLDRYDPSAFTQSALDAARGLGALKRSRAEFGERFIRSLSNIIDFGISRLFSRSEPSLEACYSANLGKAPSLFSNEALEHKRDLIFDLVSRHGVKTSGKSIEGVYREWKASHCHRIKNDDVMRLFKTALDDVSHFIRKELLSLVNLEKYGLDLLAFHGPNTCRLVKKNIMGGFQLYIGGSDHKNNPILQGEIHLGINQNQKDLYNIDLLRLGFHEGMHFVDAASRDLRIRNGLAFNESGIGVLYSNIVSVSEAIAEIPAWMISQSDDREYKDIRSSFEILIAKRELVMMGGHDLSIMKYLEKLESSEICERLVERYGFEKSLAKSWIKTPSIFQKAQLPLYAATNREILEMINHSNVGLRKILRLVFEGDGLMDMVRLREEAFGPKS
ncbi:hypothetical protein KKB55_23565 [Myxococcota bacterium]|nr:hypothetical protein [Myxococcota bacterium]MBU1900737.1 hypothetical protein [Myxococcota bacterium]